MLAIVEGDSPDSVDLLRELSQVAAHRGMGTPNERIAAQWLAAKLRALGFEVAEQSFRTTRDNLYLLPVQLFVCAIAVVAGSGSSGVRHRHAGGRDIGPRHRPHRDAALLLAERADQAGTPDRAHGLHHRAL